MSKKNFKIALSIVLIPLLMVIVFFFLKTEILAWTGCCTGGTFHGVWWNGCCYNGGSECCTVGDANDSGCNAIIPCESCCGNGSIDSGEECEDDDDCDGTDVCNDCQCEEGQTCDECTLGACPNPPLSETSSAYVLEDFISCQDSGSCSGWHYKDCYEVPSNQPSVSLVINPENVPTSKGFVSDSYTGAGVYVSPTQDDRVNEPINMVATYTDTTSSEIEALYVWFKKGTVTPVTPRYIDLDNSSSGQTKETQSDSQFGFLMHKEGTSWKPYIPGIDGNGSDPGDRWLQTSYTGNEFSVYGPNGVQIVKVKINSISSSGNSVIMNFDVSFNGLQSKVSEGLYNVFVKGNDTFGFTPYDNYDSYPSVRDFIHDLYGPEEIRIWDSWSDSNKDWGVDLTSPAVDIQSSVVGTTTIEYNWNVNDNLGVKYLVGNLYFMEGFKNLKDVTIQNLSGGGTISPILPFNYLPVASGSNSVGHLTSGATFVINVSSASYRNGSIQVNVGDNGQGVLDFHLTAFDFGGNVGRNNTLFDLRDWMITHGGLLYTQNLDVTVKEYLTEPGNVAIGFWSSKNLLNRIDYTLSDISTELVGIKSSGIASSPVKADATSGYMIKPHVLTDYSSYYGTLKGLYDRRSDSPIFQKLGNISTLSSLPPAISTQSIYIGETTEKLEVTSDFICTGKGVFFVLGDLEFQGGVRNNNVRQDACIFVVGGKVTVQPGGHVSSNTVMRYDEINAYVLSDREINILKEPTTYARYDGLYINGGVHSLMSLNVERTLKLQDRFYFPSFIVDHNSKYGVLARRVFGSQINLQKIEVGIKPY